MESSSNSVQQVCDALAIAAVVTVTVHCDNSQATRLQFSSTSGLQRDQLQSSSQDNENCCVQFSSLWAATVEYSTMPSPVVGLKTLPIVQFAGFHNCFQQLLSSKTIVKCFALLGEYSPMENYK